MTTLIKEVEYRDGKGSETWNRSIMAESPELHKELWRWEGNNDIQHQITATSIKLQTQRPQSFWSLGLSIDREEEWLLRKHKKHRKVSQRMCPVKEEKKKNQTH